MITAAQFDEEYSKPTYSKRLLDDVEVSGSGGNYTVGLYLDGTKTNEKKLTELITHEAAKAHSMETGRMTSPLEFSVEYRDEPYVVDGTSSVTARAVREFDLPIG